MPCYVEQDSLFCEGAEYLFLRGCGCFWKWWEVKKRDQLTASTTLKSESHQNASDSHNWASFVICPLHSRAVSTWKFTEGVPYDIINSFSLLGFPLIHSIIDKICFGKDCTQSGVGGNMQGTMHIFTTSLLLQPVLFPLSPAIFFHHHHWWW